MNFTKEEYHMRKTDVAETITQAQTFLGDVTFTGTRVNYGVI